MRNKCKPQRESTKHVFFFNTVIVINDAGIMIASYYIRNIKIKKDVKVNIDNDILVIILIVFFNSKN